MQGLAAAVDPTTGGVIAKFWGWRGVFFVNIPFLVLLIVMIPFCMQLTHPKVIKHSKLDFLGAILSIVMMLGLTLGLVQGRQWHWNSFAIISLFVMAGMAFICFIVTELRSKNPMIDLTLFKSRNFDGLHLP